MGRVRRGSKKLKTPLRPPSNLPCIYDLGYVRQDVYACAKCTKTDSSGKPILSGFCGGCKTACHGDHLDQVVDLYSKRSFRCDCGNARMNNSCKRRPKTGENPKNEGTYNHNFLGRYCRCDRGYDLQYGDMSQCCMCEDWFHEICFKMPNGAKPAKSNLQNISFDFTCAACIAKYPIFANYFMKMGRFRPNVKLPANATAADDDRPATCSKPPDVPKGIIPENVDYFWPAGFRSRMCRCDACKKEYASLNMSYIIDRSDFVTLVGLEDEEDMLVNAPSDGEIVKGIVKGNKKRKHIESEAHSDSGSSSDDWESPGVIRKAPGFPPPDNAQLRRLLRNSQVRRGKLFDRVLQTFCMMLLLLKAAVRLPILLFVTILLSCESKLQMSRMSRSSPVGQILAS